MSSLNAKYIEIKGQRGWGEGAAWFFRREKFESKIKHLFWYDSIIIK